MLLMMIAVIGVVTSGSMLAAPNGFGGAETAVPAGLLIGIASVCCSSSSACPSSAISSASSGNWLASALVTIVSLGIYLTLFMALFFEPLVALIIGLVLSGLVWFMIGGRVLMRGT